MQVFLDFLKTYPYIPGTLVVGFGWWLVHRLNSSRDRVNSERSIRTTELAKVYAVLLRTGIYGNLKPTDSHGSEKWINEELEDAIGKIYLYGSKRQIELTKTYVKSWATMQSADGTALLDNLRNHIRVSLGLEPIRDPLDYLRVTIKHAGLGECMAKGGMTKGEVGN